MKIRMTDDRQLRAEILQGLKESHGYCPCKLERTPDTKCKCKEFREQVANGIVGQCHCGLYIALEDGESDGN